MSMKIQARLKALEQLSRQDCQTLHLTGGRVAYLPKQTAAGLGLDCISADLLRTDRAAGEPEREPVWIAAKWWHLAAQVDPERMAGTIYSHYPEVFSWLLKAFGQRKSYT